jgi:hypothetical protein
MIELGPQQWVGLLPFPKLPRAERGEPQGTNTARSRWPPMGRGQHHAWINGSACRTQPFVARHHPLCDAHHHQLFLPALHAGSTHRERDGSQNVIRSDALRCNGGTAGRQQRQRARLYDKPI